MNISLKNLELLLWMFVPASITFLLFILFMIPKHLWGVGYVMPLLPLIPIFYWGKLHAQEMPYWFVCLIGLLIDIVSGTPLGLSSLLYLVLLVILHTQSKLINKEGFIVIWGHFIILTAIIFTIQWLVISLSNNQFNIILPAIIQYLLTVSFYPLFHSLFDRLAEHIKQRCGMISHG
jgi:rod shape-determining protein MreD